MTFAMMMEWIPPMLPSVGLLAPPDEPLGHGVGDFGRVAARRGALLPDRFEPARDLLDPRLDPRLVGVAQMLGRDVDDAARVNDVIGRVEDAARRDPVTVFRGGELVVGRAGDNGHVERRDALLGQDRAQCAGAEPVRFERQDGAWSDDPEIGRAAWRARGGQYGGISGVGGSLKKTQHKNKTL